MLGTSFDIRSYENEKDNHVAVVTRQSKGCDDGEGDSELLLPKDMTSYNERLKALKKSKFDPAFLLAWRNGVIAFDRANFDEVTVCLSRWYGVEVRRRKRI